MTRLRTTTQRVATNFGVIYVHVEHDRDSKVMGLSFSQPGKLDNSTIGNALDKLGEAVNEIIGEIRA